MKKRKLIMDCGPDPDIAAALAFAAANQDTLELLAITTVSSSRSVKKVTRRTLDLADFFELKIPVAEGMDAPLVKAPLAEKEIYGDAGPGECGLSEAVAQPEEEHAVFYLHTLLSKLTENEKVTFVCCGPLTNMAMLLKLFPETADRIREIIFAGGAARGGDITASAEAHLYADPEAARIVMDSGIPLIMCGLDAAWKCTLKRKQITKLCQSGNPAAKLCGDLVGYRLENTSAKYRGEESLLNVVPWMYLVHPEIFKVSRTILSVDCCDGPGRGTSICDFRWWEHEEEELNAVILTDADELKFQEYLISAIYELEEIGRSRKEKGI